jgi:molybdopterin-guanine dinucleotide biosynthesis protein A
MDVVAILLCGGGSRRLRQGDASAPRKEWLLLEGRTFLARVVEALAPSVSDLVVVAAPDEPLPELPRPVRVVRDTVPGAGPLSGIVDGIEAAVERARVEGRPEPALAVLVSCDLPLLLPAVVGRLVGIAAGSDAEWTVPEVGGHRQVLLSVVRPSLLPAMRNWLAGGRHDLKGLLAATELAGRGRVRIVREAEIAPLDPEMRSFQDVDTAEDLGRVSRELTYGCGGGASYTPPS